MKPFNDHLNSPIYLVFSSFGRSIEKTMRSLIFIFFGFLFCAADGWGFSGGPYNDPNVIFIGRRDTLFSSQETIQVPTKNGQSPSVIVRKDGNTTFFAMGTAADAIVATNSPRPALPRNLQQIAVYSKGQLLGGFTAFPGPSGAEAYITARHLLQGLNYGELLDSFKKTDKDFSDFIFFQFHLEGNPLDAVLAVKKTDLSKFLQFATCKPSEGCSCDGAPTYEFVSNLPMHATIQLGEQYYSRQFGSVGSESVLQASTDQISRIGINAFFLAADGKNYSTIRSSGSLVQVASPERLRAGDKQAWQVGGVIECFVPEQTLSSGVKVPPAVRVLSSSALMNSTITLVLPEEIASEPRTVHKECIPIDLRGAGGAD